MVIQLSYSSHTIVIQYSYNGHTIVYPVKLLALCNPLPKECLWQKWCNAIRVTYFGPLPSVFTGKQLKAAQNQIINEIRVLGFVLPLVYIYIIKKVHQENV